MSDQPPRRLRLTKISGAKELVSIEFVHSLLAMRSSEQLYTALLEHLLENIKIEQALLWVWDGSHQFQLRTAHGIPAEPVRNLEGVHDSAFQSLYQGANGDWLEGKPLSTQEETHILSKLLPEGLNPELGHLLNQAPANLLTLPMVMGGQVRGVLYLLSQAPLSPADVDYIVQYRTQLAPVVQAWHLREAAERESLWLSAINALLRSPHEQPLEITLQDALEEATRLSGAEGARLITLEGHAIRTVAQAGWGSGLTVEAAITRQLGERLRRGEQISIPRYDLYPGHRPELTEAGLSSLFVLPIQRQNSENTALLLFSTRHHWFPDVQTQAHLSDMAAAIAVMRVEWTLRRELAWAAYTDPLTGLGNRRAFERDLEGIIGRISGRMAVLVLLDLDGFKAINDTYGHVHADHVLVRLGGVLKAKARAGDRAYRLGGDEFALIIEGPSSLNPVRTAERYRALIEEIRVSDEEYLRASLGYTVFPDDAPDAARDITSLWRAADDQMYKDKAIRKSQVPLFEGDSSEALDLQTPLARLALRLGQAVGLDQDEQKVLLSSCYMLQLALGEIEALPGVQISDLLLREAAKVMIVLQSHWDGSGVPIGLAGERIPRAARVLQVAQAFMMLLQRVEGRPAYTVEQAWQSIEQQNQQRFDPSVVRALQSIKDSLEDSAA